MLGDLLGVKPVAEAFRDTTKAVVGGAGALLSRICLPAAEELGLALKDRVTAYRMKNLDAVAEKAEQALAKYQNGLAVTVHPRIAAAIVNEGAWTEDVVLQEMWGGLLASSCKPTDPDDQTLIYVNLLKQLTALEARILNLACVRMPKRTNIQGLLIAPASSYAECRMDVDELMKIVGCTDIHLLDRDLDHLHSLGLLYGGLAVPDNDGVAAYADITTTTLAVNLYVACQGYAGTAGTYFNAPVAARDQDEPHYIRPSNTGGWPPA